MRLGLEQLGRHLQADTLAPVYLVAGSEDLLRIEAVDSIRERARAIGYGEREVFDVDARFDWNELAASCAAMSLFAARRVIEVRLPTGKPGKEGAAFISEYCAQPALDILLLIVSGDWSKKHEGAWTRNVEKAGALLAIWPLKEGERPGWIARRLKQRGVQASADAVQLLAERVEGNLLAAAQEIDKLALLADGQPIDAERLAALVADSARFDVFTLAESLMLGDAERSLRIARGLRAEGEQVAGLLPWLSNQIGTLARLADVAERRGNLSQAMTQAGVWSARQAAFKRALSRGNRRQFEALAVQCGRVEQIAKGRADGDPWLALERLLVAVAEPREGAVLLQSA